MQRYTVWKIINFHNSKLPSKRNIEKLYNFPISGCEQSGHTERNTGENIRGRTEIQPI